MNHAVKILIVEDNLLIAKQIEQIVTGAGHVVVGQACDAPGACALAQAAQPDVVFLDVSLNDGPSGVDAASVISDACGGHILFTTANRRRIPDDCCGAVGVVEKPFTRAGLLSALGFISARIHDDEAQLPVPASLQLSPLYEARWQASMA